MESFICMHNWINRNYKMVIKLYVFYCRSRHETAVNFAPGIAFVVCLVHIRMTVWIMSYLPTNKTL